MAALNYHHLRYFRAIAHEGNLTRAAERLHVSASALSTQLRSLEEQLGQPLFERNHKRLVLTEAGRIALEHADAIFRTGDELMDTLQGRGPASRQVLRIGALATLSRNFQIGLLRAFVNRTDIELVVRSGSMRELLAQLDTLALDVVLSNQLPPSDAETPRISRVLDEQPVSLVGRRTRRRRRFRFPDDLHDTPILLPSLSSELRVAFDLLLAQSGIRPLIVAEVDDMAMLRLLARESPGVTLVPPVVVVDELERGILVEYCSVPQIRERFYAITRTRRFPNPLVRELLERAPGG
jgi:LysR family transcriptional activator of nhaA